MFYGTLCIEFGETLRWKLQIFVGGAIFYATDLNLKNRDNIFKNSY